MPVDDLWYLKSRTGSGQRAKSKVSGKGSRWRVRFHHPDGRPSTKVFQYEEQARAFDTLMATGMATVDEAMNLARALAVAAMANSQFHATTSTAPPSDPTVNRTKKKPRLPETPTEQRATPIAPARRTSQIPMTRSASGGRPKGQSTSFHAYAERWRASRRLFHSLEHQRHVESHLFTHIYPFFTWLRMDEITTTMVLEWLGNRLGHRCAHSSLRTYFNLLNSVFNAAKSDGMIQMNPCTGINLGQALNGINKAPKWVPTRLQAVRLLEVVPDQYNAAIWFGVAQGLRFAEVMGLEAGSRCIDTANETLHVVQQLRFHTRAYGGFYLCRPKSGSIGHLDLDEKVASATEWHVRNYPPVEVLLPDVSRRTPDPGRPLPTRKVSLLFYDHLQRPLHDRRWSALWCSWREQAGWPKEGTFHSLRHFFATTMIQEGVEPTEVQHELRHAKLETTWSTYIHWWPQHNRPNGLVSSAILATADEYQRVLRVGATQKCRGVSPSKPPTSR